MATTSNSSQAKEMADESMVRNLAAQAEAIWPQEEAILLRHPPRAGVRILDIGCGTGEIAWRLGRRFSDSTILGVDLEEPHLERARARCADMGSRVRFQRDDALALQVPDASFDLVLSRHVVQAVPDPLRAIAEMARVLAPGGRVHLLAEDYGMLWCHPTRDGSDAFWQKYPPAYGRGQGCDLHVGRKAFTMLHALGFVNIAVDYVVVDTIRVPRETFARIWEAWRDGYTDGLAQHAGVPREEVTRGWNEMIACARSPDGYALWQVPIWTAQKP